MTTKKFTLTEANALLPRLKEELARLQRLTNMFEERLSELKRMKNGYARSSERLPDDPDPFFELESELEFMRMEIELAIGNFERQGVQLKMIHPGLLDFPGEVDGRDVLLCWKEGESRITHYHGWDEGFAGRKSLPGA
ncbi:DUF2203 domain-containing protein [Paenibacillus xanthanilyticus]|uniref:DUF2203 domain-containing protein n=1 Tax=Paenibacillus xanthanilyticus TaxID=1783531 RepID=A0ABV8K205_9BACL